MLFGAHGRECGGSLQCPFTLDKEEGRFRRQPRGFTSIAHGRALRVVGSVSLFHVSFFASEVQYFVATRWSRQRLAAVAFLAATLFACGSSPPPEPAHPQESEPQAAEPEPPPVETTVSLPPAPQQPPSTASYEEALSVPEPLDPNDTRAHLTDLQLTNPMREVPNKCRINRKTKVVIKVAVQNGRAIGVTVLVTFEKPPPPKRRPTRPPSAAAVKAEAKAKAKLTTCFDQAVRAINWPPNSRRDSFTTEF
jgi:hypothetical protein